MGKHILTADDFIINKNIETRNGSVFFNNIINGDYNVSMVSSDIFNIQNNTSIVFEFKADPYVEKKDYRIAWFNNNDIIYINPNKEVIIKDESVATIEDEIDCNIFVKGCDTNQIVLNKNRLYAFGSNDNNQLDNLPTENIISADVCNNSIIVITIDSETKKNIVKIFGNKSDSVPDTVNNYESEIKKPSKVAAFNGGFVVIKADGTIEGWGDEEFVNSLNTDLNYRDIYANDNSIALVTFDNLLYIHKRNKDETYSIDTIKNVQSAKVFNDNVMYVTLSGKTILNNNIVYRGYPKAFNVDGQGDYYVLKFNKETLGKKIDSYFCEIKYSEDKIPEMYSELKKNSFNVFFGVQPYNIKEGFEYDINEEGGGTFSLSDKNISTFYALANNNQGVILSKSPNGADLLFNVKAQPKKDFLIDNFFVVPETLIDYENNTYKLVISFSEFGKTIRLFKTMNGDFVEVNNKFISLEEYPPSVSRIALYIKSCSSFELKQVIITDELNTSLLPEEILYRNLDTNLLQTKIAESLNKHIAVAEKTTEAVKRITSLLGNNFKKYNNSISDLNERVSVLEEQ
jgi:hypothetical protein